MEAMIQKYISELQFGEMQKHKNMAFVPLLSPQESGVVYITLKEALDIGALKVTEVSEGGSVPDLKVINRGDMPVLILDGEEVAGAKQNRIVNTTILVRPHWEGVIPVSCTEQGRWDYVAPDFKDSDVVMSHQIRAKKSRAVHYSLNCDAGYRADQGEIWDEIGEMAMESGTHSPTGAMNDVYEARRDGIDEYLKAFEPVDGQKGLLVMIDGKVAGFDIVSLESAYLTLHPKLIRSYAMAALLRQSRRKPPEPKLKKAKEFLDKAKTCREDKFESLGLGWDYRYRASGIVGSSLVHDEKVIHMAFFAIDEDANAHDTMANYRNRRRFRM